jgi:Na+-transporting NADH:ubiquinone oxidoreductase subunit NqrB
LEPFRTGRVEWKKEKVMRALGKFRQQDPRHFQIAFLSLLLLAGLFYRDFTIRPEQILLTFAAGLLTQHLFLDALDIPQAGYKSAVITCLGLSLLCRADNLWMHPLVATLAISAKFLLRLRGKHLFNPGNLGMVIALCLPGGWCSPGQWGNDVLFAGWFLMMGFWVIYRARTMAISWAFLFFYLGALFLRVTWLGQRDAVFIHQVENGSLLLFTFFMISDPMTIPSHWKGRVLHAALVAGITYFWQFKLFWFNGPIWALFIASFLVPLWDLVWPAEKPVWKGGDRPLAVGCQQIIPTNSKDSLPAIS